MKKSLLCSMFVLLLVLAGCGGGSHPIAVTLTPGTSQSMMAGHTLSVTATVTNDSKQGGVTWSLQGAGALSGQTSTSTTYTAPSPITATTTATVTATSVSDPAKTATITINLEAVSISLAPTSPQTLDQAQVLAIAATVSDDPATKGVSWTLSGSGTLSGQTTSAATYTAPASVTASASATITATSIFDGTKTSVLTVNLVVPPSVTTTSLAAGQVGAAYSATLAASNGVSPYIWNISSGALPGGLTISGNKISGTPTAYGTFNFTVQVKDADGLTATAPLSIKVAPAPVAISTTSLPNGIVNSSYSATLQATGGATPISWSVTIGTLPGGLTLNPSTGAITGTPTTAGTSNFTVQASDSSSPQLTATKALSITVIPVLSIATTSLPSGITSTAYSANLTSTGGSGPITWSVSVGTLPAGLKLNSGTGAIAGTPTTAGTSNFTVQAADSGAPQQKVTEPLSITIIQQLVISTTSLPTGAVTSTYGGTLQSSGGTPAVTWVILTGALPGGLNLTASTGAIAGTPTASGTLQFTAQATDSGTPPQVVTKQLNITINPVLSITTTSPMATGTQGTVYSQTVQTNGGGIPPLTWSITSGSLPAGLNIIPNTGAISGTPTSTGTFNFAVQAVDSGTPQQSASKALSLSIQTAPLSIATTSLPNGVLAQSYANATLQSAGGTPPVTWSISAGSLPSWATLNTTTGAITGTPNASGTTTFTVKAADTSVPTPQTATKQLSILVNSAVSIGTVSLPNGIVGSSYSATMTATGGVTPYKWSIFSGALPTWASLNTSTGAITGIPNAAGTANFTVQVTDSSNPQQAATQALSVTATVATLTVSTTSGNLPQGAVNTVYPATLLSATGGIPPYSWGWSAAAGSELPPGLSLNSTGQITGTPTTAGTYNVVATVTDSATPTPNTANANLTITVSAASASCSGAPTGNESMLKGQYAFLVQGFQGSGNGTPAAIVASFHADGAGHVTGGDFDINVSTGETHSTIKAGTYTVGLDSTSSGNLGCIALSLSSGSTTEFRFGLGGLTSGVFSKGRIVEYDDTTGTGTRGSGVLRLQDTTAFLLSKLQPHYVFGADGVDAVGNHFGTAGFFAVNTTGTISSGVEDMTGSKGSVNYTGGTGSIGTVSTTTGRATMSLTFGVYTAHAAIYMVNADESFYLGTDTLGSDYAIYSGRLIVTASSFSTSSFSGSYIFHVTGIQTGCTVGSNCANVSLGLVKVTSGSISGTSYNYDVNNGGSSQPITGTLSVDATSGRTTISGAGGNPPVIYIAAPTATTEPISTFMVGTDDSAAFGMMESQPSQTYSVSGLTGKYFAGTEDPGDNTVENQALVLNVSSTGTFTGSGFKSGQDGLAAKTNNGTVAMNADGVGNVGSGTVAMTNGTMLFFIDQANPSDGKPAVVGVVEKQ